MKADGAEVIIFYMHWGDEYELEPNEIQIKIAKFLANNGVDVVITPDGPRGPRRSISDGSVTIAQKTGVNVVVLSYKASKFWQFNSWDKMILPKPFSKLTYYISGEFSLEGLNIQEAKNLIVKKFDEVDSII